MKSIIYVELTQEINYHYQKELITKLQELLPEADTFDLDNHSDPTLFNYAIDLIRKSDQSIIVFQTEKDASSGRAMVLLEEVLNNKNRVLLISIGENKFIEKISKQLPHYSSYSTPELVDPDKFLDFFKTSL